MLLKYLPPEKNAVASDAAGLRNFLETSFCVKHIGGSLRDVNLLAGAVLDFRGESFPCTQSFLEDMVRFIKMPASFAYGINFDLFQHIFLELRQPNDHAVKVCIVDGRAVGLVPGSYRPARTIDVLDALPWAQDGICKIQKSSLSDRSIEIDLLSEDFTVEPKPGDVIRTGVRISNSETGGYGLKASIYTYRLVCSNGAVMSNSLGTVRWTYDKRVTYVSSVAKFSNDLLNLRNREPLIKDIYSESIDRPLTEEDVTRLWRRIRSAGDFTPEHTDQVLGITDEERRRLAAAAGERMTARQPAQDSNWDLFTMHNRVTAAARELPFSVRSRLEQIGGDVLSLYSLN